jgi:hypothetical protein
MKKLGLIALLLLVSCNPYRFQMGEGNTIDAEIRSPLSSVERGKYEVTIRDTGILTLGRYSGSQYRMSFYLNLLSGEGATVSARPRVGHIIEDRGITMRFDRDGVRIDSSGVPLIEKKYVGFAQDTMVLVQLYSDSHLFQAISGCDTLIKKKIAMMESDDIIIQPLPNSEVQLIAPQWDYLPWF